MKSLFTLSIAVLIVFFINSISMLGIEINDTKESVEDLNLSIVGEELGIVKYRTKNGNDLSVTFENDKVVYMENDWLFSTYDAKPLLTDFTFGKTSIDVIRKKFGTNGFTYSNRLYSSTDKHIVTFNCFEFDSEKNEVLVVVTGFPIKESASVNESNISEKLLLQAIIIADKSYLDKIWGEDKVYYENYKKIQL